MIDPGPHTDFPSEDVVERFWELCERGGRLDPDAFLAQAGALSPATTAAILRIDQRERWRRGEPVPVESYFAKHPGIVADTESALDLIFNEYLLCEQRGETPDTDGFLRRFPEHSEVLRAQIELHRAVAGEPDGDSACGAAWNRRWQVEPAPSPDVPGYEVLGEISRGGMGVVYKARQVSLNRMVALKMISSGAYASPAERARFRTEAEAAARLRHPNIVQIYEAGSVEGMPYLALEYMDGGSLAQALNGTPLPPRAAAELVELLARTVQAAHQQGILHRDLKPANVLLQIANGNWQTDEIDREISSATCNLESVVPKITDFGLAKDISGEGKQTTTGAILGTPSYMAPEQAQGGSKHVGPGADVYALGAMLYETLTGRPPFQAATMLDTLLQVRTQEVVSPSLLQHNLPRDLVTICLKALAKEPQRRYASATTLADDLRRFLNDEPITARPVTSWERGWRWFRRNPVLASISAAAFLLLVAAVVALTAGIMAVNREKNRTQQALEAESIASQRARQAMDEMFSQVVEDWLTSRTQLDPAQKAFLEKALGYYEAFATESADSPDIQNGVGNALLRTGHIRELLGQQEDALRAYGQAQTLYEGLSREYPTVADYRSSLAESYSALGDLLRRMGRLPEGQKAMRISIDVLKQQVADFPQSPDRRHLARSQANLGASLRDAGRPGDAELALRDAITLQQELAAEVPAQAEYRVELAGTYNKLAILMANTRRLDKAEQAFLDSIAVLKQLTSDFPGVPRYRHELAIGTYNMGTLFMKVNRSVAEAALRDALAIYKQLVADFPSMPMYRRNLANCHHNLALIYQATSRKQEAESAHRDTVAIRQQLAADFPSTMLYQEDAAKDINGLGIYLMEQGKSKEAESSFREALSRRQELARLNPTVTAYQGQVTDSRAALAVLWSGTGECARAMAEVAALEKDPHLTPGACYDLACACALASAAIAKDPKLAATERDNSAEQHAIRAVGLLSRAVASGYTNFAGIKTDPDLIAIHSRPEFKNMMRELQTTKKPATKLSLKKRGHSSFSSAWLGGSVGDMPRTARASVGNVCHQVLNRGNARNEVFHKDADFQAFLKAIENAHQAIPMRVLASRRLSVASLESISSRYQSTLAAAYQLKIGHESRSAGTSSPTLAGPPSTPSRLRSLQIALYFSSLTRSDGMRSFSAISRADQPSRLSSRMRCWRALRTACAVCQIAAYSSARARAQESFRSGKASSPAEVHLRLRCVRFLTASIARINSRRSSRSSTKTWSQRSGVSRSSSRQKTS
jgi:serine/threonine protein kinase